jgi:FAD synthase
MTTCDPYLEEVFPEQTLTAYRRQTNISDNVIRAKVPANNVRLQRKLSGMTKCGKSCLTCPFDKERKEIKDGSFVWKINKHVNCNTSNFIYIIECDKESCK